MTDLSAYLIAGRVVSHLPPDAVSETAARTPAQGIADGEEAERLGFRRVFLSERFNLKEAGVILGAVGARTERLGLATGLVSPAHRHLIHMAAFGATMQACFGPRFVLGIGRGDAGFLKSEGLSAATFDGLCTYVERLHALWRGEAVDGMRLGDVYEGPPPEVWYGTFALPKAAAAVARAFDGVLLPPVYTPDATRAAAERIRDACERAGRDPSSVRICQCVITAPDLSEEETRALAHARAVTYLQAPGYAESLVRANGWDMGPVEALRRDRQIAATGEMADTAFHRVQLMEPARLVPDEWMQESCALGTVEECVAQLERFRAAGADEITTYGSTPGQNAGLIEMWRERQWSSRRQPSSMPSTI